MSVLRLFGSKPSLNKLDKYIQFPLVTKGREWGQKILFQFNNCYFSCRSRIFYVQDQNTHLNQTSPANQPNICIRLAEPSYYPTQLPPSPVSESGSLPKSIVEADCAPESPAAPIPAVSDPCSPCSPCSDGFEADHPCTLVIKEESSQYETGFGNHHGLNNHLYKQYATQDQTENCEYLTSKPRYHYHSFRLMEFELQISST